MKKESIGSALLKGVGYVALFYVLMYASVFLTMGLITLTLWLSSGVMPAYEQVRLTLLSLNYESSLLFDLVFIGVVFLIFRKKPQEHLGVKSCSKWAVSGGAVAAFPAYLCACFLVLFGTSMIPSVNQSNENYQEMHQLLEELSVSRVTELLYAVFFGPLVEELLFRGILLRKFSRVMHHGLAIFLSATAFALVHGNLYQMFYTLPLGILLGYLAWRYDSIWPAYLCHALYNFSNYPLRFAAELGISDSVLSVLNLLFFLFCVICLFLALMLFKRANSDPRYAKPVQKRFHLSFSKAFTPPFGGATENGSNDPTTWQGGPMAAPEFLIVGLGNPGEKYAATRHNCGFMAVDYIALRENASVKNAKFSALVGEVTIGGKKGLLMKPTTFMNLSGNAVREAAAFYRIPPEKVLVIFDDINFAPGVFRIRKNGSAGGHNGIKSIIASLGSEAFPRVKIGIGSPLPGMELMHHVLGVMPKTEQDAVLGLMEDVYATVKLFVAEDLDGAMAKFNVKK